MLDGGTQYADLSGKQLCLLLLLLPLLGVDVELSYH